jgi:hypothetical protein
MQKPGIVLPRNTSRLFRKKQYGSVFTTNKLQYHLSVLLLLSRQAQTTSSLLKLKTWLTAAWCVYVILDLFPLSGNNPAPIAR